LGSREDWAAYEPDEPYVYPDDDYEIDEVLVDTDIEVQGESVAPDANLEAEVAAELEEGVDEIVESDVLIVVDEVVETQPYGEGSYAGPNPPEDFTIKGNERSMKYHLPGSAGYARTNGDVWFASEETAEAAGFVRAQR
jgi:hypothetical protein